MPAHTMNIREYLKEKGALVDTLLDRYLPPADSEPRRLHEAMRYSVLAPGKRLRPILALLAFEHCGGQASGYDAPILYCMAALEMVHTYSLIHDDLPCMDDDELRRGMPTCHVKFGEATAVLAGDALHDVAFGLLARTGEIRTVAELSEALGTSGMIGGQMADVEAEGRKVTYDDVVGIHRRKTGMLIRSAVRIGAIIAGADSGTLERLTVFGDKVGLAFQIIDDILDVEGDRELLGKNVGSDSKKQKATYPAVVGMERARRDAARLIDEAVAAVPGRPDSTLAELAVYIGQRNR
jgi:geranylgeranyl diphosphate synthase type II